MTDAGPGTARRVRAWGHRNLRGAALRLAPRRHDAAGPGSVALTFDDGPDPRFTAQILDVLAAHRAQATFFLVGRNARRHPDLVARTDAAGHAIGSHTWSHRDARTLSSVELLRELWAGRRAVEEIVGRPVRAFRAPAGHLGARMGLEARLTGMQIWHWTANPQDWRPGTTAPGLLAALEALADGDVVLLHDGLEQPWDASALDRSATVAALPGIIALARSRGLELRALDVA